MNSASATAIFSTDLASAKSAPEWVELFPAGPKIEARDGRSWIANPDAVIAAFLANKGPLAIDYEHGQAHLAPKGERAPAAGWIVKLENRGGAVWGQVEWTEAAAAMIAAREYRFLSPEFFSEKSGRVTRLMGAGLVNRPALVMTALSRENQQETDPMKAIAKALGLAETADETAILAQITVSADQRKALCVKLQIDAAATAEALTAAIDKLQTDTATALAAVKASPAATDLAALQTQLRDTQTALAALQGKDADREIDAALDRAAAEGKITPASRETYRAMCKAEGGLERFKALAATLPKICEPAPNLAGVPQPGAAGEDIDPRALAARATKYQQEQAAAGVMVSISDAVEIVKGQK